MQVYEKSYYTQIYFPYSTVTSACHGSGLACTCNVTFWNANVHAEAFSSLKQTVLHRYRNEIITVYQLQLNYFTNIHLLIPRSLNSVCYNHKTKYTDWCPIPNDGGWGIWLRLWKEVALKILNNGHVYITRSVITRFFLVDRDGRLIMESVIAFV